MRDEEKDGRTGVSGGRVRSGCSPSSAAAIAYTIVQVAFCARASALAVPRTSSRTSIPLMAHRQRGDANPIRIAMRHDRSGPKCSAATISCAWRLLPPIPSRSASAAAVRPSERMGRSEGGRLGCRPLPGVGVINDCRR